MKKIENLLIFPFLFALFGTWFPSTSLLSIMGKNASIVISSKTICTWFVCYLIVVFVLYKLIRKRQRSVNAAWGIGHIVLTFWLIAIVWFSFEFAPITQDYIDTSMVDDFSAWASYNLFLVYSVLSFSLVQTIFWIYFVVQMVKKRQGAQQ